MLERYRAAVRAVNNCEAAGKCYRDEKFADVLLRQLALDYSQPEQGLLQRLDVVSSLEGLRRLADWLASGVVPEEPVQTTTTSPESAANEGVGDSDDDCQPFGTKPFLVHPIESDTRTEPLRFDPASWEIVAVKETLEGGDMFEESPEYAVTEALFRGNVDQWIVISQKVHLATDSPFDREFQLLSAQNAADWFLDCEQEPPSELLDLVSEQTLSPNKLATFHENEDSAAMAAKHKLETRPPPPVVNHAETAVAGVGDADDTPTAPLERLTPTVKKAWASWKLAEENHTEKPLDRAAYVWLEQQPDDFFVGDLVDYELPKFDTWGRYVRQARKAADENKNQPRGGRSESSGSVARADEL